MKKCKGREMKPNLESLLRWTCPRCDRVVEPILGVTIIKDGSGYRMRCLTCEPMKERE